MRSPKCALIKEGEMAGDDKIYMLNALWFKPEGGFEKYQEYSRAVMPFLEKYGGRKLKETFIPEQAFIGDFDADMVFFVEWPNLETFQKFVADPDFQPVSKIREEALTNSLLIQCSMAPY